MTRPIEPWEIETLTALGIGAELKDDVLTLTFGNGMTEMWGAMPGRIDDYPGLERLTLSERVFVRLDQDQPRIAEAAVNTPGFGWLV